MAIRYFRFPWATTGDRATVPFPTDIGGSVSYAQGFGPDYEIAPGDPGYKPVPREETNGLYYDLTAALQQYQLNGVSEWFPASENGGIAIPYPLQAMVRYNDVVYRSIIANNTVEPGTDPAAWVVDTAWQYATTAAAGVSELATNAETLALVDATRPVTPANLAALLATLFSSSAVTLYIRSDGSDSNNGSANNAANAFLTIQGAINYAFARYGISRAYDLRIGLAGTYAAPTNYPTNSNISITGDAANPQNFIIATGANEFGILAGRWSVYVYGCTIRGDNTSAKLVEAFAGGYISLQNVRFTGTAVPFVAIRSSGGGYINISEGCVFACSGTAACIALANGFIIFSATAAVSYASSPAYSDANMVATDGGVLWAQQGGFTGTATGKRYRADANGVIRTGGGGPNLFPGNAAGTTSTGGQYL